MQLHAFTRVGGRLLCAADCLAYPHRSVLSGAPNVKKTKLLLMGYTLVALEVLDPRVHLCLVYVRRNSCR